MVDIPIESDSISTVTLIQRTSKRCNWSLAITIHKIKDCDLCSILLLGVFIEKEGNFGVDYLATEAIKTGVSRIFTPLNYPTPTRKLLYQDKCGSPVLRNQMLDVVTVFWF